MKPKSRAQTPLNAGFRYRERIGAQASGSGVVEYLASHHRHSPESVWRERVARGQVHVDGMPATATTRLRTGQELVWARPPWREPPAPLAYSVLFEDEHLVGVHKPAGLPTLPGAGFLEHTLLHQVRRAYPEVSAVHRLGRWTSGVVLMARTPRARSRLSLGLRRREIVKRYLALGSGCPERNRWVIDIPIGKVPHAILGSVHAADFRGVPARTEVEVLRQDEETFLAQVVIRTGRPHQIRIHMAASGHPLAGDPLYPRGGVPPADSRALPGDPGYRLHASEVLFSHPGNNREFRITAPDADWVR